MQCLRWVVAVVFVGLFTPASHGVVVRSHLDDVMLHADGALDDLAVGRAGSWDLPPGPGARAIVFVFELPDTSLPVQSAQLWFNVAADLPDGAYTIDLYGLRRRSTSLVEPTDMFAGPLDTSDATLIQQGIVPQSNNSTGWFHTSEAGNTALAGYLNAQYGAAGANAGEFVFLRINPSASPPVTENSGVDVYMSGLNDPEGEMTDESLRPYLDISFVPEPSVSFLLPLLLLCRRAR